MFLVSSSSSVPRNFYSMSSQIINWITSVSMEAGIQYINILQVNAKYGSYDITRLDYKLSLICKLLSIQIAEVSKTSTSTNLHGCIFWYVRERSHSQDLNEIPNG